MSDQQSLLVADLLLDEENARLKQVSHDQQQATYNLAKKLGRHLVKLAQSIVQNGLDPAQLLSVVSMGDGKFVVKEGNRRTLALKALETPAIVQGALAPSDFRKLQQLSEEYVGDPIEQVECIVYDLAEARVVNGWVFRRHTGAQEGAGLVDWDSNEKDRFSARFGETSTRSLGGQALDFLEAIDGPLSGDMKIATTLTRILTSREVRQRIGLERRNGQLLSRYPKEQIVPALRHIVNELTHPDAEKRVLVTDVYHAADRTRYAAGLPDMVLPKGKGTLATAVTLSALPGSAVPAAGKSRGKGAVTRTPKARSTVAAAGLNLPPGRCKSIYEELRTLSADAYANAGSVLLRVFLELSVDQYVTANDVMSQRDRDHWPLARRMKAVADHLQAGGKIDGQLKKAVHKIADSQHTLAASVVAFHQYVHNEYVHPKPSELRTSWDELHPFLAAVWA